MSTIDVLDLPPLYTRPSAETLLQTLALFAIAPPSWDRDTNDSSENLHKCTVNPEGVTRYLTSIVSNSLKWIKDDDSREQIWEQASQRLSERSGRTAMGALTRKFRIPTRSGSFELSIHEPALTGDDLGLKTWAASYMLAKKLHTFDFLQSSASHKIQVLELGSGTGLVGMAMAGLGACVVLTDMLSIHENLSRNARNNLEVVQQNNGSICTGVLDWTNPSTCKLNHFIDGALPELLTSKFPVILAADSLYSPDHPQMLVDTIGTWLSGDDNAKVVVEFPYRQAYLPEIEDFRQRMTNLGLHIESEGEEQGYDDWGSPEIEDYQDKARLVTCWWSCWTRRAPSIH